MPPILKLYSANTDSGDFVGYASIPEWFQWYFELGKTLAQVPKVNPGEMATRVIVSAPSASHVPWAICAGALSIDQKYDYKVQSGDLVAAWSGDKMRDCVVKRENNLIYLEGVWVKDNWPVALLGSSTPEGRSVRRIPKESRDEIKNSLASSLRSSWYVWYSEKCVLPVSLVGQSSRLLAELDELLNEKPDWFSQSERVLLKPYSLQVTNPNQFAYFPYAVLSPSIPSSRPWIREVNSRIVIVQEYANEIRLDSHFQAGAPKVILTGRRKMSAYTAHIFAREIIEKSNQVELLGLPKPPEGVYVVAYKEFVHPDSGHANIGDFDEDFEL
jgi:hypothetical protein